VAAGKKKKALAVSTVNATSALALERQNGVGCEALTSRESRQLSVIKRTADKLSG
jgi:hypothetical protein